MTWTTSYYHFDGLGSTDRLTDASGNITDSYVYQAYGAMVASTGSTINPFRFIGQSGYYLDLESGDYHVRARVYDPTTSRWLSKDPLEFGGSKWNWYEYVDSDPVSKIDPSGLSWLSDSACYCLTSPVAIGTNEEVENAGIDDRDDLKGGNAFQHCVIACRVQFWYPFCSFYWNVGREGAGRIDEKQDIANNLVGGAITGVAPYHGCWDACMEAWKNGKLYCQNADRTDLVPCPPPEKDYPFPG